MATDGINEYYDLTENREVRDGLAYAVGLVGEPKVAIDCGCGAGSDIAFLRANGFMVYAFDFELESVERCRRRFSGDDKVIVSHDSFSSYAYPAASLVCADASLFFCPEQEFDHVWSMIGESLSPGGIFSGSFLGPKDTMAGPDYDRETYWSDVLIVTEEQLRPRFDGFEIMRWIEQDLDGKTAHGKPHHWHIYSVVARKR